MPPTPTRTGSAGTCSTNGAGATGGPAGCVEVAGRGRDAGLRVCRSASPRRRALPDRWGRPRAPGGGAWMPTVELIATSARTRRIAGAEQVEPSCLAAGKWLAGLRTWTIRGCFRCARHGQGRGPGNAVRRRSGVPSARRVGRFPDESAGCVGCRSPPADGGGEGAMPRPSGSDTHPFLPAGARPGLPPSGRCWLRSTLQEARVELERGHPQMGSGRRELQPLCMHPSRSSAASRLPDPGIHTDSCRSSRSVEYFMVQGYLSKSS